MIIPVFKAVFKLADFALSLELSSSDFGAIEEVFDGTFEVPMVLLCKSFGIVADPFDGT